ncbi:MAG: PD-(D/E)XK nuclease family protein [Ketobacter sp.]|nr:PD-(D/E)XK nuclease family protein [Ketobacter sp.]
MSDIIKMSATSIGCFKACPKRYFYRYILGLTPIEDSDALRVGTNYHRVQEIYDAEPGGVCGCYDAGPICQQGCPLCEGTGVNPQDPMDAVVRHLNERYSTPPLSKTVEEWQTEKITILYTLVGYRWWYEQQDKDYTVESLEQSFDIPLLSPVTGNKLQGRLRGKIDRVFACGSNRFVHDYKSTSKSIDMDSTFWSHLTLDTQTRLYTYAAAQMGLGMCGVLYDAWHKPGIKPKKLSQADSKAFVTTGEYCGEEFEVVNNIDLDSDPGGLYVNRKESQVEPGKKPGTFTIRETPELYGARLLEDIYNRPEFYFARKEIVHHSTDIENFKHQLANIYYTIREMKKTNRWWENEHECEATFKCPFIDLCYNHIELGPDEVPDNFTKRGR